MATQRQKIWSYLLRKSVVSVRDLMEHTTMSELSVRYFFAQLVRGGYIRQRCENHRFVDRVYVLSRYDVERVVPKWDNKAGAFVSRKKREDKKK